MEREREVEATNNNALLRNSAVQGRSWLVWGGRGVKEVDLEDLEDLEALCSLRSRKREFEFVRKWNRLRQ